jgi:putative flippase GtrA
LALSFVGLAVSDIPVGISEYILKLHSPLAYNISSTLIGTALGTVWRFWAFRRWVFLDPEPIRTTEVAREALI